MLYRETSPNTFTVWNGEPINDIQHPLEIERVWSSEQLNAVGLYRIEIETDIPEGKRSTGFTIEMINGVLNKVHSLDDVAAPDLDEMISNVDAERDKRISQGFTFNGEMFQSRPEDLANINGATTLAIGALLQGISPNDLRWANPDEDFGWLSLDNVKILMGPMDMIHLGSAAMQHKSKMVWIGRISVILAMLVAVIIAPLLGIDKKGGFEFIQEYTGFVSPGIFAMFILGFFWKKTSSNAAMFATVGGFVLSVIFKFLPQFVNLSWLKPFGFATLVQQKDGSMIYEIPFLDRMGFVFIISVLSMILISLLDAKRGIPSKGLEVDKSMFKTNTGFAIGAMLIIGILVALYTIYW